MEPQVKEKVFELRLTQCDVGRYNLLSNEQSLSFYLSIYEDGKVAQRDGVSASLHYSGEAEELSLFEDWKENLPEIFEKCFAYGDRVWSTQNYSGQCRVFAQLYQEHYAEMDARLLAKHKEHVQKEIDRLQEELEWDSILKDLSYSIEAATGKIIKCNERFIASNESEIAQLIEGSPKRAELTAKNDKYRAEIESLKSLTAKEAANTNETA